MTDNQPIKTMNLYKNTERFMNELKELGVKEDLTNLTTDTICSIPSLYLNYGGRESVDKAMDHLGVKTMDTCKLYDVGCGFGGPARYIVKQNPNVSVVGIDIQKDMVEVATLLSEKTVGLNRCTFECGDFSIMQLPKDSGDGLVCWLTILHMGKVGRLAFLKRAAEILKDGAFMFIEDYCCSSRERFSQRELELLSEQVYCNGLELPTVAEYKEELEQAGFSVSKFDETADEWTKFVYNRWQDWITRRDDLIRIHGAETYNSLLLFYESTYLLFAYKTLLGCRIVAQIKKT